MEEIWLYTYLLVLFVFWLFKLFVKDGRRRLKLPPSPPGVPVIGHLHLLKDPIPQTLHKLAQSYGPVMSFRFGSRLVVMVSSPSAVEECFTKNDVVLANRPHLIAGKHLGYNYNNLINAPYGEQWRNLRRIASLQILSVNRMNASLDIRRDEVKRLISRLYRISTQDYAIVQLSQLFKELSFNNIMRMISGKRYYGEDVVDSEESGRFVKLIGEVLEFASASHPGDFLPVLRWIDYGGYEKRVKKLAKEFDAFFQGLIAEHRGSEAKVGNQDTMIDHLLLLQESEPEYYSDDTIKGLILVMLIAGSDTSSVTIEWAMSLLLNHPEVLDKARLEIDVQVGCDRLIDESDLPRLHQLQNIISETLRLFPAVPLLLPHLSSQDCEIQGFDIPSDTLVMVNAWAIHRDANLWDDPEKFKPERFEGQGGSDPYKLVPFGMGRRGCPGAGLANRVVALALGTMLQCFEWKRVSEKEEVDLTPGRGLTLPKLRPLEARCKARPFTGNLI